MFLLQLLSMLCKEVENMQKSNAIRTLENNTTDYCFWALQLKQKCAQLYVN